MICSICPRKCGVLRDAAHIGFCSVGEMPVVSRAAPHYWEEPCISGERGSGAVFFAGCNLRCVFCQNHDISAGAKGKAITVDRLREIFRELEGQGVHDLNLVTGAHFLPAIRKALDPPPGIPVVWNSGGYESVLALKALEGRVQVYLPDMKYMDGALAAELSGAGDYPEVAQAAISEMFRQTGPYVLDDDGMLVRGVMIRHLVLPGQLDNTFAVLDWIRACEPHGPVHPQRRGRSGPAPYAGGVQARRGLHGRPGPSGGLHPGAFQRRERLYPALRRDRSIASDVSPSADRYSASDAAA